MATKLITKFCWRNNQIARMFEIIENKILKGCNFHIAGGSALKLYLKQDLANSDIDIWFSSMDDLNAAIAKWSSSIELPEHFIMLAQTDNGFTFYCTDPRFERCFKVQMISKDFHAGVEDVKWFDFTVCQVAYKHGRIYMTEDAYRDIGDKVLRMGPWYNRVLCHTRLRKYMLMGFTPTIELYNRAFVHGHDQMTYGSININNAEFYEN